MSKTRFGKRLEAIISAVTSGVTGLVAGVTSVTQQVLDIAPVFSLLCCVSNGTAGDRVQSVCRRASVARKGGGLMVVPIRTNLVVGRVFPVSFSCTGSTVAVRLGRLYSTTFEGGGGSVGYHRKLTIGLVN